MRRADRISLLLAIAVGISGCADGPRAIVDPARPEHYFDVPFPSNDLLDADGLPDLTGFPVSEVTLIAGVEQGWVDRIALTAHGFGNQSAAYFRFDGPVDVPVLTEGTPDDPVFFVSLDGDPEILPVETHFVADPHGDPHYAPNTLAVAPRLGFPPRSGGTYAAVVMRPVARPAEGWEAPDAVVTALKAAGVRGRPAVATVFTVQDTVGQLRALKADLEPRLGDWGDVTFHRVTRLQYELGTTPSGKDAVVSTATFEGGGTSVAYLTPSLDAPIDLDLLNDWPLAVYQAEIDTFNYQDQGDRPYMSPGLGHILDTGRFTGWIDFDGAAVASEPWREPMRIVVSLPKGDDGEPLTDVPVVLHDHGTAGHAYNVVQRRQSTAAGRDLAQVYADAGVATIGRDATLYGTRYPLIDQGYGGSLGFYNVVNLPAFRDNQRQTAIDGMVLHAYVATALNGDLPAGSVDPTRILRSGHSLGSVTGHLGMAAAPEDWEAAFVSGTGGDFSLYFLDTGLLAGIDAATIESLFTLLDQPVPEVIDTTTILGAAIGLDEGEVEHIDRLHPLFTLFQWTMDPSDPMAVARSEDVPIRVVIAPGDFQTPDYTAEALAGALPDATVVYCDALGDYDPHHCLFREEQGAALLADWLASLP